MNRKQFLEVLFDHDHISTCGKDDKSATWPITVWPNMITHPGTKFSINPIKTWRNTENVIEAGLYSMLFEMDKDAKGNIIAREEQIRLFNESGLPWSTMTWSGTKSIHVIVRMEERIPEKLFEPLWKAIYNVLTRKGCSIDPATCKIPQISRMPESIRENGQKQDLIGVRSRISRAELGTWLKSNGETVEKPKERPATNWSEDANATIEDEEKWRAAYNMYKSKWGKFVPSAATGNWVNLINFSTYCYKVDLSIDMAIRLTAQEWGVQFRGTGHQFSLEEPMQKAYDWCQKRGVTKIILKTEKQKQEERLEALRIREQKIKEKYG